MFKTPYETTVCRQYNIAPIMRGLQEEMIEGRLRPATFESGETFADLYEVLPHSHIISPFTQTIRFEHRGKNCFAVDMRPFLTKKPDASGKFNVYSDIEYYMAKTNAMLSQRWMEGFTREQSTFGDIAGKTFTRLLTDSIVRRLAVGVVEQMQIAAVSAFYYLCLFDDMSSAHDHHYDEDRRVRMYGRVARLTMIPAEKIVTILENVPFLTDLQSYCDALRIASNSMRFHAVNPAVVITSVGNVWFGANSREHIALGLEYPPTFNALVYCALTYRGYHSATLSRLIQTLDKNNAGKDFYRSLTAYLKD